MHFTVDHDLTRVRARLRVERVLLLLVGVLFCSLLDLVLVVVVLEPSWDNRALESTGALAGVLTRRCRSDRLSIALARPPATSRLSSLSSQTRPASPRDTQATFQISRCPTPTAPASRDRFARPGAPVTTFAIALALPVLVRHDALAARRPPSEPTLPTA